MAVAGGYTYTDPQENLVTKDLVFVSAESNKRLLIIDVTDLANPTQLSSLAFSEGITGLVASPESHLLFAANGISGLKVIDIRDPIHPIEVGTFDSGPMGNMAINGSNLFGAMGSNGVKVVEFDPGNIDLYDSSGRDVDGAVTDGITKIRIHVSNIDVPNIVLTVQVDEPGSGATDIGYLLGGVKCHSGTLTSCINLESKASGRTVDVEYLVPNTFVRTDADKEIPVRNIHITVKDPSRSKILAEGNILLRRPPVLLVHGIWASGDRTDLANYTWTVFESKLNLKKLFFILPADYHDTNDTAFSVNAPKLDKWLRDTRELVTTNERFAVTKVDIVAHSMGGMLIRVYCKLNPQECIQKIHKFITLDSPHTGTEVANEAIRAVQEINTSNPSPCVELVSEIHKKGMRLDKGAPNDASVGSPIMQELALTPIIVPTHALSGKTLPSSQLETFFALDKKLNELWRGLAFYCKKVPNSGFASVSSPSEDVPLFPDGGDDRFIPIVSQQGGLIGNGITQPFNGVDHATVHKTQSVADEVKRLLEAPTTEDYFQLSGFWGSR